MTAPAGTISGVIDEVVERSYIKGLEAAREIVLAYAQRSGPEAKITSFQIAAVLKEATDSIQPKRLMQ